MKTRSILVLLGLSLCLFALGACSATVPTPVPVSQPAATLVLSTATALPPTATVIPPTATKVPPTATKVPPTATKMPPTATNTALPPTATNTAVPPTKTFTSTAVPPTATKVPPTATPVPPTATSVPPTATKPAPVATKKPVVVATKAPPAAANSFTVTWKPDMGYEARTGDTRWCQFHNETQNLTTEDMPFQDLTALLKHPIGAFPDATTAGYQPVFAIANGDGTINRYGRAGWYAKLFGWPNGIEDFPPKPVAGGATSGDWTWYSVVQNNGEYCRYVYVRWKGQVSVGEYAPDGKLINTNATLPPGAP